MRAITSVVNRYYDPATDQFLSIDPDVATTNQPYVFTNDNPLNFTDPSGEVAVALMGGGSQSLKQEAATINLMLESQMTNFGGPVGVTPFVTVASLNGTSFLALVLTPDDPGKGKIKVTILSPNAKQLESKGAGNSSNLNLAVLVGGTVVGVTGFLQSLKLIFLTPPDLPEGALGLTENWEWAGFLLF